MIESAISVVLNQPSKTQVFEKIFPVDQDSDMNKLQVYNKSLVIFERLARSCRPSNISMEQFMKICKSPINDQIAKPEFVLIYQEHKNEWTTNGMNIDGFNKALEHIAKIMFADVKSKRERFTAIVDHIFELICE